MEEEGRRVLPGRIGVAALSTRVKAWLTKTLLNNEEFVQTALQFALTS